MDLLTKIKAQSCIMLEELSIGFGLHICSFLHQHFHMLKASSFNSNVQGCLTCAMCSEVIGNRLCYLFT